MLEKHPRSLWWRLLFSLVVFIWAIAELIPLKDRPVGPFLHQRAADAPEIQDIITAAENEVAEGRSASIFLAMRDYANEQRIDLASYFKGVYVDESLSLEKRNQQAIPQLLKQSQASLRQGLDLKGGLSVTLEIAPEAIAENAYERNKQLEKVQEIMRRRIDGLGVAEPVIRSRGNSQVEIQLAGIFSKDNPDILNVIKKPAKLEFRLVSPEPVALNSDGSVARIPAGYEVLPYEITNSRTGEVVETRVYVKKIPEITGKAVKTAAVMMNPYGGFEISLEFNDEGAKRFERVTQQSIGKQLGIVLDGKLYSAPVIRSVIPNGRASISGQFSQTEAIDLANVLNNPLEFELRVAEVYELGPSLAEDVRTNSINAAILGTGLVILFMLGYYTLAGLVAVLSVGLTVAIILGIMAMINATMTLPGVAALVLTIGMSVDANILIFSRMKEELAEKKNLRDSIKSGFEKAFSTIFDANLTTLLTAAILMAYGTGPVKGFGVILGIGVIATMFSALVFSRGLLEFLEHYCSVSRIFPNFFSKVPHFDFMKWRKPAFITSWSIILIGLGVMVFRGNGIYGIDFTGGNEMVFSFAEKPSLQSIYDIAERENIGEVSPSFQMSLGEGVERLKVQTREGYGATFAAALQEQLPEAQLTLLQETHIGSSVGESIKWNAVVALLLALLGILLYIAFRFEIGFAMGAIVSTIHDVLITLGIFVMLGHQFSAPMVAAILMIVGYSINDTIVVFDRIREELPRLPKLSLAEVINYATNHTLSRTLLTSITTFMAALSLYIFGAGVVTDFALIFIIGILTGTFSSIFIATPVFYWWHRGNREGILKKEENPLYSWDAAFKEDKEK